MNALKIRLVFGMGGTILLTLGILIGLSISSMVSADEGGIKPPIGAKQIAPQANGIGFPLVYEPGSADSPWSLATNIFTNGTNVGIGKVPSQTLDVNGHIAVGGTTVIDSNSRWVGSHQGMAGIDFIDIGSKSDIQTTVTNLGSIAVACPSSGFVLLQIGGQANFFEEGTAMFYGFGTSSTSNNLYENRLGRLDGTSIKRWSDNLNGIFVSPCSSATTFHANARKSANFDAGQVNLSKLFFTATFFPIRY